MKDPHDSAGSESSKAEKERTLQQTRMLLVHGVLMPLQFDKRRKSLTMTELSEKTDIPLRSLERIIELMRDVWKMPIGKPAGRGKGVGYTELVTHFPILTLSETQVAVLAFAQQLMALFKDTPYFDAFRDVMRKAIANTNADFAEVFAQFHEAVSFHTIGYAAPAMPDPGLIARLIRAVVERREIVLQHKSAKTGAKEKRVTIHPRHVANVNHAWYVWFDEPGVVSNEKRKKYALTRIKEVQQTGNHFKPTRKFDIYEELGTGVGAYNLEKTSDVRIRFDAEVATYILEKNWHDSQVLTQNADGSVEVQMQVCLSPELDNLVLPWAGRMEVLSPPELRERIRTMGEALVARHLGVNSLVVPIGPANAATTQPFHHPSRGAA
jgi:predicted DNA-binding transcriptional regulator YafY